MITFKEYLEDLNKMAFENPKVLELPLYTASDDEGNSYNQVYNLASFAIVDEDGDISILEYFENVDVGEIEIEVSAETCNCILLN